MANAVLTNLRRTKALVFLGFLFVFTQVFAETKIEIDLDTHVLKLYQDEKVIKTYPIAYGRGGVGKKPGVTAKRRWVIIALFLLKKVLVLAIFCILTIQISMMLRVLIEKDFWMKRRLSKF